MALFIKLSSTNLTLVDLVSVSFFLKVSLYLSLSIPFLLQYVPIFYSFSLSVSIYLNIVHYVPISFILYILWSLSSYPILVHYVTISFILYISLYSYFSFSLGLSLSLSISSTCSLMRRCCLSVCTYSVLISPFSSANAFLFLSFVLSCAKKEEKKCPRGYSSLLDDSYLRFPRRYRLLQKRHSPLSPSLSLSQTNIPYLSLTHTQTPAHYISLWLSFSTIHTLSLSHFALTENVRRRLSKESSRSFTIRLFWTCHFRLFLRLSVLFFRSKYVLM